jgi:elongation factor P
MISTSEFKKGDTIIFKGDIFAIVDLQFVNPGKGSAFVRTKLKNIKTQNTIEHTFKSGEKVEEAPTETLNVQYLYKDDENYYFMVQDTFEQHFLDKTTVGSASNYIKEEQEYVIVFYDKKPISLQIPLRVNLKVISADPGVKGDSATTASKNVTVETGYTLRVPLFIKEGETISINTETGKYVERVKG